MTKPLIECPGCDRLHVDIEDEPLTQCECGYNFEIVITN